MTRSGAWWLFAGPFCRLACRPASVRPESLRRLALDAQLDRLRRKIRSGGHVGRGLAAIRQTNDRAAGPKVRAGSRQACREDCRRVGCRRRRRTRETTTAAAQPRSSRRRRRPRQNRSHRRRTLNSWRSTPQPPRQPAQQPEREPAVETNKNTGGRTLHRFEPPRPPRSNSTPPTNRHASERAASSSSPRPRRQLQELIDGEGWIPTAAASRLPGERKPRKKKSPMPPAKVP